MSEKQPVKILAEEQLLLQAHWNILIFNLWKCQKLKASDKRQSEMVPGFSAVCIEHLAGGLKFKAVRMQ